MVESQIEEANTEKKESKNNNQRTPAQVEARRRKEVLLLSRTQVRGQIEASHSERYTQQLNRALADLDAQIAQLDSENE